MDFSKLKPRKIVSEKLILTLKLELGRSTLTAQESADKLQYLISSYHAKPFSDFIVFLLRETKSSTWDLRRLEIEEEKNVTST